MRNLIQLCLVVIVACSSPGEKTNDQLASTVAGTYTGNLPCSDCTGIRYRLLLHPDHRYDLQLIYEGRDGEPLTYSNSFAFDDSVLVLQNGPPEGLNRLRLSDSRLQILDEDGQSYNSNQYVLVPMKNKPRSNATAEQNPQGNDPYIRQFREGIDFTATGTEPFWQLEMDFDKVIRFTAMDGPEITMPPVEPIRAQDANVNLYRGTSESGTLEITIIQSTCQNAMNGFYSPFKVNIRYKSGEDTDFTEVSGCGNYVANPRLHNIWAVISLNEDELDNTGFPNGLPRLELYAKEGRVMGFDGCNTFRGTFYEKDQELYFSPLASSLKACSDVDEAGPRIIALLSGGRFTYEWSSNRLLLKRNDQTIALRNID